MARKHPKLIVDGHDFKFDKSTEAGTTWSCPFYFKTKCKCKLKTAGNVVQFLNNHNHPPKDISLKNMSFKKVTIIRSQDGQNS